MDQQNEILQKLGASFEIDRKSVLGSGRYGTVFRGTRKQENQQDEIVAVKEIKRSLLFIQDQPQFQQLKIVERLKYEIVTWKMAQHPNIVRFLDFIETDQSWFFISEYCEGPTLEQVIKAGKTSEQIGLAWLRDIASALSYLHSMNVLSLLNQNKIIHRDIKPANIIFNNGVPKIVDFGFAKKLDISQSNLTVGIGTPKYMAPEILCQRDDYQNKVDIWSLGWTFYEVFLNKDPFPTDLVRSTDDMLNAIVDKKVTFPKNCDLSSQIKNILEQMLEVDEFDRCDHLELLRLLQ